MVARHSPIHESTSQSIRPPAFVAACFVALLGAIGSLSRGDLPLNAESTIPAVEVATGNVACMYPGTATAFPTMSPLYPAIAGLLISPFDLGQSPLLTSQKCSNVDATNQRWLSNTVVHRLLEIISVFMWLVLAAGSLALIRTTRWRHTRAEVVMLFALGLSPVIMLAWLYESHAEDFLCVGLLLFAAAAVHRGQGVRAGIFAAAAILAQPFGILGVVVVVICAHRSLRRPIVLSGLAMGAMILGPLVIVTSGRAISGALGGRFTPSNGDAWTSQFSTTHLQVVLLTRVTPVILSALGAVWARRRYGDKVTEPAVLIALMTLGLSWRLLFEINVYGYYFMAMTAGFIVTCAVTGRFVPYVVAWLGLMYFTYPFGGSVQHYVIFGYVGWGEPLVICLLGCALAAYMVCQVLTNPKDFDASGGSTIDMSPELVT